MKRQRMPYDATIGDKILFVLFAILVLGIAYGFNYLFILLINFLFGKTIIETTPLHVGAFMLCMMAISGMIQGAKK